MALKSARTALYRLYDAEDRLLYVGIAVNPERRWKRHARDSESTWWPSMHRKSVEWFADRDSAEKAETRTIQAERPAHNRAKMPAGSVHIPPTSPEIDWTAPKKRPIAKQVAGILRAEIAAMGVTPGTPYLTLLAVTERFKITQPTAIKALRALASEELIHQKRKAGRYYCGSAG